MKNHRNVRKCFLLLIWGPGSNSAWLGGLTCLPYLWYSRVSHGQHASQTGKLGSLIPGVSSWCLPVPTDPAKPHGLSPAEPVLLQVTDPQAANLLPQQPVLLGSAVSYILDSSDFASWSPLVKALGETKSIPHDSVSLIGDEWCEKGYRQSQSVKERVVYLCLKQSQEQYIHVLTYLTLRTDSRFVLLKCNFGSWGMEVDFLQ